MSALAEAGTTILRLRIACEILREWSGSPNYDARVIRAMYGWIDAGMIGPVPWPNGVFFAEWAEENGFSNIDGAVGYRVTVNLKSPTPCPA